jgi:FMN-dependent NADH-azoreductase
VRASDSGRRGVARGVATKVGNKSAKEFIEKAKQDDVIELDLSHKKIADLPDSIGDLKSLIKASRDFFGRFRLF